jgi:hypothetical protein
MGTYRNPEIIIDTDGEISSTRRNQAKTSAAISSIGQELRKASDRNRARKAANWNIYRQNSEASLAVQEGIVSEGLKKGLDEETLRNQSKDMMSKFANAKIRLEQSTGYYDGYEADKAYVENTKQALNNLPDLFSSMSLNVNEYENSIKSKGLGSNSGQINPRFTEPQFAIMNDIANNRPGVSGSVSWRREYTPESGHQWFQVAKGSSIKDANMKMYEETGDKKYLDAGDEYVLSYTQIRDNQRNSDGNIYNETTYIKNPSIMSKEDGLGEILSSTVINDTGELKEDMYTTDYFERETSIEGMEGKEIAKRVSPNVEKIAQTINPTVDTWANLMTRYGPDTLSAYIETSTEAIEVDGVTKFFSPTIMKDSKGNIMKDSEGNVMLGPKKQIGGEEGYFETDYNSENSKRNGYSEEDYKDIQELIQYDLLRRTGALSSGVIQRDEERSKSYKDQLKPSTTKTTKEPKMWELKVMRKEETIESVVDKLKEFNKVIEKPVPMSSGASSTKVFESIEKRRSDVNKIKQKVYNLLKPDMPKSSVRIEKEKGKFKLYVKIPYDVQFKDSEEQEVVYVQKETKEVPFDIDDIGGIKKYLIDKIVGFDPKEVSKRFPKKEKEIVVEGYK